jgi:endo-1,4-beta-xylanase
MIRTRLSSGNGFVPGALMASVIAAASTAAAQNLLTNPGFETGTSPWSAIGCSLTQDAASAYEGSFGCSVTARNDWWAGPRGDVAGSHPSGTVLLVTGAMRLDGQTADDLQLRFRADDGVNDPVTTIAARRAAQPGVWYELRGIFPFVYSGAQPSVELVVSTRSGAEPFSVDGLSVTVYEEDPDWRQLADAGIEQHRTRDMTISVVNTRGEPVGGVLDVRQVGRRFAFGATVEAPELLAGNQPYMGMFPTLFEWTTPRNALKWRQTEKFRDVLDWSKPDSVVAFCQANAIPIYGHNIFWGGVDKMPDWLPPLNNTQMFDEMTERLDDLLGRYADDVAVWDVNNEMLHVTEYLDRFGPTIRPWMFDETALRDPDALLFLNDYSVVGGGNNGAEAESYVDQALDFIGQGVQIDGMGAQCHFNDRPIVARWIRERLDVLGAVGVPLRMTEFDVLRPDVNERADDLEKFYRVAFSHPAVEGITLWGWWGGNHGLGPDAAIVDTNFTINAAGQRYLDLLDEWTTDDLTEATGRDGRVTLNAFHGDYELTFTAAGYDGRPIVVPLEAGQTPAEITFTAIGDCTADVDASAVVDAFDLAAFLNLMEIGDPRTDLDGSGGPSEGDVTLYLSEMDAGCP